MPRVGKHEITEDQIRSYVLRNQEDALSYPELQTITYDYLLKVIRKAPKFDKWPKKEMDLCYSVGIRQDKETGLPIYDNNGIMAWSLRAESAEDAVRSLEVRISSIHEKLESEVKKLEDWDEHGEYCDSQACDSFLEAIKKLADPMSFLKE